MIEETLQLHFCIPVNFEVVLGNQSKTAPDVVANSNSPQRSAASTFVWQVQDSNGHPTIIPSIGEVHIVSDIDFTKNDSQPSHHTQ